MFLHAEVFATQQEAKRRYLVLSLALRHGPRCEIGVYNLLLEDHIPCVVLIAPERPELPQEGKGQEITLPFETWEELALRHDRGRARGPHEHHHEGGAYLGPGGETASRN